jgi:hypothetical protein
MEKGEGSGCDPYTENLQAKLNGQSFDGLDEAPAGAQVAPPGPDVQFPQTGIIQIERGVTGKTALLGCDQEAAVGNMLRQLINPFQIGVGASGRPEY